MAETKAEGALNQANPYQLKIWYTGPTPTESGWKIVDAPFLDRNHYPWLIRQRNGRQFVDSRRVYQSISRELNLLLDAAIVNEKQKRALEGLIDKCLFNSLGRDLSGEDGAESVV